MTNVRPARPALPTEKAFAAHGRSFRIARHPALPSIADQPVATWRIAFTTPLLALHPRLAGCGVTTGLTRAPTRARYLLALGTVHFRADRHAFLEPHAVLSLRAPALLAGGEAHRLWHCIRAEEARWTPLCICLPAGPGAPPQRPAAAEQAPDTRSFAIFRKIIAGLALLPHPDGYAHPYQGLMSCGSDSPAHLTVRTVRIPAALAVGAVLPKGTFFHQAAQRRLTRLSRSAVGPVRRQPQPLLGAEHRADPLAGGMRLRRDGPLDKAHQHHERQRQQHSRHHGQHRAPPHPHFSMHSGEFSLPGPQYRSSSRGSHGWLISSNASSRTALLTLPSLPNSVGQPVISISTTRLTPLVRTERPLLTGQDRAPTLNLLGQAPGVHLSATWTYTEAAFPINPPGQNRRPLLTGQNRRPLLTGQNRRAATSDWSEPASGHF